MDHTKEIRKIYGYQLSVQELQQEIIRLNHALKSHTPLSHIETNISNSKTNIDKMKYILDLHRCCCII